MKKIIVVGCGNVGMVYINNLINHNLCNEIVLIDIDKNRILGEEIDLGHSSVILENNIKIRVGDYNDCSSADIVVITAGYNQKQGETRLDLINKNNKIIKSIVDNVTENDFKGIFLIATNPVDIMTYAVRKYSNFPNGRVIGTGTLLDTERLKYILSQKININTKNIHAYVLGEHGDSSFIPWSKCTIGMVPIKDTILSEELKSMEDEVKSSAYNIINYKGYTNYGVAMCLLKITKAILNDENAVLNVSSPVDNIYIGMPSVINKDGIKGTMKLKLDEEEQIKLNKSKAIIKKAIDSMEV